ncbi:type 1 glutamine amidotransferase domain-containing protein [Pseudoalteromonas denitrificans]|uniref:Putative intracellular protease/amidase n=1 Tax=Pseudoalteromonas denitrificans DSM 6059 TaxID=1123010 RepID=A0A1I1IFC1_9GAMM|nr:type 1 glutamine amidotransferase domain-containing protein [Pseudoalteromonas denitrificans]SFC32958.1 Putative intracellular protease/amidase [Pseudoalteromonas denitrificans DSM 6059]
MPLYNLLKTSISKKTIQLILVFISILFMNTSWSKNTSLTTQHKKVLFIVSSDKHGYFMSEVVEPYQLLQDAGFVIDIASPKGGQGKRSGMGRLNNKQVKWLNQSTLAKQLKNTIPLKKVNTHNYSAVYFSGGSGPMFDLSNNTQAQEITRKIYQNGGIVAADCHGPVALVNVKLSNGQLLIAGKKVTGKANTEEGRWGRKNYPFLLEDKLIQAGALYSSGPNNLVHVVEDERLITAQNPASAILMTEKLINQLKTQ